MGRTRAVAEERLYAENLSTRVVHRILAGSPTAPSDTWRTVCGFRFGLHAHVRLQTAPKDSRLCRTRGIGQNNESDDSGSSPSSSF